MIKTRRHARQGVLAVKTELPTKYKGKKYSPRYNEKEAEICENCTVPENKCKGNCKLKKQFEEL